MKHRAGEKFQPSASIQNKLEQIALSDAFGATGVDSIAAVRGVTIRVENTTGDLMDRWSLCQLGDYVANPDETDQGRRDPTLEAEAPVWPAIFGRGAIVAEPIPAGKFGRALVVGIAPAVVNVVTAGDQFAAPDYADPTRLRSADTGEFSIIGSPAVGVRTVLVGVPLVRQATWHYERTDDYPGAAVKLLTLGDIAFSGSATVTLTDARGLMDDQVASNRGICDQVGSKFLALQASC